MDLGDSEGGFEADAGSLSPKRRTLPADLPRSLDDRRHVPVDLVPETEMYDGWQGWYSPSCLRGYHGLVFPPVTSCYIFYDLF